MGGEQSRVDAAGGAGQGGGGRGGGGGGGGGGRGTDGVAEGARRGSDSSRPISTSPRPSISSDADLPYISYTVNRPIGDSPKHTSRGLRGLRGGGGSPRRSRYPRSAHTHARPQEVVVVREAASTTTTVDPELARLQSIPTFLPIMRGALTAPSARDPEVLERLDTGALVGLCRRYQCHLHLAASTTTHAQDALATRIREVESGLNAAVASLTDRQKNFARYAEKLGQVNEINHALARCHASLNLILESLDALNTALPITERLEPFVWTTG